MEGETRMYITCDQCDNHRREIKEDLRELKADYQRSDDMMVDEMRGMRNDFKIGIADLKTDIKWAIGIVITIFAAYLATGYFFK